MFKRFLTVLFTFHFSLFTFSQGWPSDYQGVMLQGFYWDSFADTRWTRLESQAQELGRYFDLLWIPNSGYCSDSNNMGYLPYKYWNQNSSFGTEAELRSMISTLKQNGVGTIADVVINHHNSNGWFDFPKETYKGQTYQFLSTDICSNDDGGATKTQATKDGVSLSSNADTGTDWSGCRDLDHKSANVQKIIKAYEDYLLNDLGYTGFRYDMVIGYGAQYLADYNTTSKPAFSVGEYWESGSKIKNWIDGTKVDGTPTSAAFDFQFRYRVRDAVNGGKYNSLKDNSSDDGGYPLAYQNNYKRWAVTFVENHDTQYRSSSEPLDPIKKDTLAANAYLLAMPGTPCVFLKHWLDCKKDIKRMITARKIAGISNLSDYTNIVSGAAVYSNEVKGTNGSLVVVVGTNAAAWTPSAYSSTHTKVLSGYHYNYYLSNELVAKYEAEIARIEAEEKAEEEEAGKFTPYDATIYCKADFTPVYFFAWDSKTSLMGGWPGSEPSTTTIQGETWYYHTFPITAKDYYFNIIFNQGSGKPQTSDITFLNSTKYYTATISGGKVEYVDVTDEMMKTSIEETSLDSQLSTLSSPMYNLMGARISAPAKGQIYIQNGKKHIIK